MPGVHKEATELRKFSETEIERLIAGLDSISEGELGISLLVACGEQAVLPLRRFLLCGAPKSVYVGRQRAVRALGQLGAVAALIEYLTAEKRISDPILRYSEEAVENSAARELQAWKTEEVFSALLQVINRRPLRGAVEAIGSFGRPEAVPALIRHLEDDVARSAAEEALRLLRAVAVGELIATVRSPEPSATRELPGSLRRRQSALKVLSAGAAVQGRVGAASFLDLGARCPPLGSRCRDGPCHRRSNRFGPGNSHSAGSAHGQRLGCGRRGGADSA